MSRTIQVMIGMKFGTESNTKLMQKYVRVKVQMTYVHPNIYINTHTPDFQLY